MDQLIYKQLETNRLILRQPKQSDYTYQYEYLKDKKNFPYADYKVAYSLNDVQAFFDKMLQYQLKTSLFWMICDKESDEPIGTISAWNVNFELNSIEFGYSLYPNRRGKGYMLEAIQVVMQFCNEDLGFTIFDIWTDKSNVASIRLARRLGFKFKGYVDEPAKNSDDIVTYATYSLEKY